MKNKNKFLQVFAAIVLVIGIGMAVTSSAATPTCSEVESGAGKQECNPAKTWSNRAPDKIVPDFEEVETGGFDAGSQTEFSLTTTAAGTDPAALAAPLSRFSGINSPFMLYDKGPTNIADNLVILGLGDTRVGLINNGPILLQPVPSDGIPPPPPPPDMPPPPPPPPPPDMPPPPPPATPEIVEISLNASSPQPTTPATDIPRTIGATSQSVGSFDIKNSGTIPAEIQSLTFARTGTDTGSSRDIAQVKLQVPGGALKTVSFPAAGTTTDAIFTFSAGELVLAPNETKTLPLSADISNSANGNDTFRLGFTNAGSIAVKNGTHDMTGSFPVQSSLFRIAGPDLIPFPGSFALIPPTGPYYAADPQWLIAFEGKVKNNGTGNAIASTVRFCINKPDCGNNTDESLPTVDVISDADAPALAVGAISDAIIIQTPWYPPSPGAYTAYFCVEVNHVIAETNESNNCTSLTFSAPPTLQIGAMSLSGPYLPNPIRGGTQRTPIFSWYAQDATATTSGIRVTGYKIHLSSAALAGNLSNFELMVSDDNGRSDPWYPVSFGTIDSGDSLTVSFVEGFNVKTPLSYRIIADVACDTSSGNMTVSMNSATDVTTAITANVTGLPVSQNFTMPLCPTMTLTQLPSDNPPEEFVPTQTATIAKFKASANTPVNVTDLYIHQKGSIPLFRVATPKIRNFRLQKSTNNSTWSNVPIPLVTPAQVTSQDVHFAFGPVNPPMQLINTTDTYYRVEAEMDCDSSGATYGFTIDSGTDFTIQSPTDTSFTGLPFINPGNKMPQCDMPPPPPVITVPAPGAVISDASGWVNVTATDDNRIQWIYLLVQMNSDEAPTLSTDFSNTYQSIPVSGNNYQFPVNWSALNTYYGSHELRAVTRDTAGNTTESAPINIIRPDPQNPTVAITAPANNAKISSSSVNITATATDNVGVASVKFYVNGSLTKTDTASPYDYSRTFSDTTTTNYTISAVATDTYGNVSTASSITITIDTAAPVVSSDSSSGVTYDSATITWTTNESAYSQVEYDTTGTYGTLTSLGSSQVTSHSQTITGLASNTTYYFRVRPKDFVGNIGYGRGLSFTTQARPDLIVPAASLDVDNPIGGAPIPGWSVSFDAKAKNIGTAGADSFNLRLRVDIGNNGTWDLTPSNKTISSLAINTESSLQTWTNAWPSATSGTHTYEVCADTSNAIAELNDSSASNCTTTAFTVGTDTTLPVISSILATGITNTSATITWTTDEVANSEVRYGLTNTYGSTTGVNATYVTAHSMSLTGLSPATTYHFQVKSADPSGNMRSSGDLTFNTTGPDLYVSAISWTPTLTEGAVMQFTATVRNDGAAATVGSPNRIRFCMNNTSCATSATGIIGYEPNFSPNPLGSLASGTINAPATWTATNGDHRITVCADILSVIKETIETNNCTTAPVRVRPDLLISSGPSWSTSLAGSTTYYNFSATVKNNGNAAAPASSTTRLRIDTDNNGTWDYNQTRTTAALARGATETETWNLAWAPPLCISAFGSCVHTIQVCADSGNTVHEGSAYLGLPGGGVNNCSTRTVTIGGGGKSSVLHASALGALDFGEILSAGFSAVPVAQAAAADDCPVAIGGITLCNPLTVYDDLYVADNEKGEPGNIIAHGKFWAQDGIETAGGIKAGSLNSGSIGRTSKIGGETRIDGNMEIGGNAALRNDAGTALNVVADSIGAFYTKTSSTAAEATQYGTALPSAPLITVACDEPDDIVLDCFGFFDPAESADIFGKTQSGWLVDSSMTAPNTCGVRAQKMAATPSLKVYAQAVCFSPDG